jgi:hypothetical protein
VRAGATTAFRLDTDVRPEDRGRDDQLYRPHPVAWTPAKVARFWAYYAAEPAFEAQYFSTHSGAAILDRVDRQVGLRGRRILDFGCGRGAWLALAEIWRLLTHGGRTVVTTPNGEDVAAASVWCRYCGATYHSWQHQGSFSVSSLVALLKRNGFATLKAEALAWGESSRVRLKSKLLRRPAARPHPLYVGRTSLRGAPE